MTSLPFLKMQAQGNDFVVFDGRVAPLPELAAELMMRLADRREGVGCDQVLVLLPSEDADARLRIFNQDGSEAGNCGNGLRCIGELLLSQSGKEEVSVLLPSRRVRIERGEGTIRVHMGLARVVEESAAHVAIDIGNPHRVVFEATEDFPGDTNIEIVTGATAEDIWIEIIERGVGRTLACGSGACATALAVWHREGHHRPQRIHMPGGTVTVSGSPNDLVLEGSVAYVFRGELFL